MKTILRYAWITQYLEKEGRNASVDVLDAAFVDAYLEAFNPLFKATNYGAHKCQQLGRDLSGMHKAGMLQRWRTGITDGRYLGFPPWVYTYRLPINSV